MRRLLGRVLLGLLAAVALVLTFGPTERVGVLPDAVVPARESPEATVAAVVGAEDLIPDIAEGARKEVIWADPAQGRTPLSVVHVHGLGGDRRDLGGLVGAVAAELGANLYHARLAGHGRGPAALAEARAEHWMLDMAEALAVGKALGERVLVIAASTGATLAILAASEPSGAENVAGYVLLAPDLGDEGARDRILTLPFARRIAPALLGETVGEGDGAAPTEALVPAAAVALAARATDHGFALRPALFGAPGGAGAAEGGRIAEAAGRWGGEAETTAIPAADDPLLPRGWPGRGGLGPAEAEALTAEILRWTREAAAAPGEAAQN